jgi:hypothetical protein
MFDPRFIPRPAMFPLARPCRLTTTSSGPSAPPHTHRAYADRAGNGATDTVAAHFHYILSGKLQPSADGHTHTMTAICCGTGR